MFIIAHQSQFNDYAIPAWPRSTAELIFGGIATEADLVSRLRHLEALERVHQALARTLDAEALLQGCVETVLELFEADRCLLGYPPDAGSDRIRYPFYAERPRDGRTGFPREAGPDESDGHGIRSRLSVPIRPASGPAWNLTLHQCAREREWTPEESGLLGEVAARLRPTLENLALTRERLKREAFLRAMTEAIPHLLWTTDGEGKVEFVNRRWMEFTGQSREHSLGTGGLDAIHPEDQAKCLRLWTEALRLGRPYEAELRYRRADGTYIWHLTRAYPVLDDAGKAIRWIGTCTDISEDKRAREEAEHAREQLATILSGAADAIMALEPDGKMIYANEAAARLFDLPSAEALIEVANRAAAEGRRDSIQFLDENGAPFPIERIPTRLAMQGMAAPPAVLRFQSRPDASERWVVSKAKPIFDEAGKVSLVISLTQDITELRARQEAMRRLEKLESLGKLAGGIAHDFNNLLVTINGYSELGLGQTEDQTLREYFGEILRSGQRAASLTQQLLAYGRKQMMVPRLISLNAVVRDTLELLSRVIGEDVRLLTELADDLPPIQADPSQIGQVIMNLVVNARDAMPSGGTVTLATGTATLEEGREEARPGPYATLTVADTGMGMDPSVLARAFEPFFTTKGMGAGSEGRSGLGLASVYGIVKQCGGLIEAESEVGQGARFRVYLPVAEGEMPAGPGGRISHRGNGAPPVILLVEDEDSVRIFNERMLAGRGFRILSARDGADALSISEAEPTVDLLLTDVVMPKMRGPELALRVRERHPEVRILLISGYPEDTGNSNWEGCAFLQKPYLAKQLLESVDALLKPAPSIPDSP